MSDELTPEERIDRLASRLAGEHSLAFASERDEVRLEARQLLRARSAVPVERPDEATGELERLIEEQRILRAALRPFADAARSLKGLPAKISESEQTAIPSRFFLAALDALESEPAAARLPERPDEDALVELIAPIIERMESRYPETVIARAVIQALPLAARPVSSEGCA